MRCHSSIAKSPNGHRHIIVLEAEEWLMLRILAAEKLDNVGDFSEECKDSYKLVRGREVDVLRITVDW